VRVALNIVESPKSLDIMTSHPSLLISQSGLRTHRLSTPSADFSENFDCEHWLLIKYLHDVNYLTMCTLLISSANLAAGAWRVLNQRGPNVKRSAGTREVGSMTLPCLTLLNAVSAGDIAHIRPRTPWWLDPLLCPLFCNLDCQWCLRLHRLNWLLTVSYQLQARRYKDVY